MSLGHGGMQWPRGLRHCFGEIINKKQSSTPARGNQKPLDQFYLRLYKKIRCLIFKIGVKPVTFELELNYMSLSK